MATYQFETTITGNSNAALETIEIKNPAASGKKLAILQIQVLAEATFQTWIVRRYNGHAAHGSGGNTPDAVDIWKRDSAAASPAFSVFSSGLAASFDWSALTKTWQHSQTVDASDAGDDAMMSFTMYIGEDHAPMIREGESVSIVIPAAELEYTVVFLVDEIAA